LKVVGAVTPGLNIFNSVPLNYDFGEVFVAAIPIALIAYMESFSVGRKIAVQTNELHILNASQELWANGVANLFGSISGAYPVSGSFSRSALNYASGCKTPLSKVTTLIVVLVALSTLTDTFRYIPQASLAAVIFAAISSLISFTDLWENFKHSKRDFFVLLSTWIITLTFNTELGIAIGLALSIAVYCLDIVLLTNAKPEIVDNGGSEIQVVKINSDMTFLTANEVRDTISTLTFVKEFNEESVSLLRISDKVYHHVSSSFDSVLNIKTLEYVSDLPRAIVIDLAAVRLIDITGFHAFKEIFQAGRAKGIKYVLYNVRDVLKHPLEKFGLYNDDSSLEVNLELYQSQSAIHTKSQFLKSPSYSKIAPTEVDGTVKRENSGVQVVAVTSSNKYNDENAKENADENATL